MAKALSMEPRAYVLSFEQDAPEDEVTKWFIRPLTFKERSDIQDNVIITEVDMKGSRAEDRHGIMRHLSGTQSRTAMQKGLVKVENLLDHEGNIIRFDQELSAKQREEILDRIPPDYAREITEEILRISGLGRDEQKN